MSKDTELKPSIMTVKEVGDLAVQFRHWATQAQTIHDSMRTLKREAIEANVKALELGKRNISAFLAKANKRIFDETKN